MSTSRFSVALCTRNGARFLPALLDSLAVQTQPPFELVVCDDESTDRTCDVLDEFARHVAFPVHVHINREPLGVVRNFERTIGLCSGTIIALADQDDCWYEHKLERLAATLAAPNALAAFSDADVVGADLAPLGYSMWQRVNFAQREQSRLAQGEGFRVLLKHRVVTGATLAFKPGLREMALPIPDGWQHDAWLALIAAAQGGLVAINESLIAYRQHAANAVGGMRKRFPQEMLEALALDRANWYRKELALWHALSARLETRFTPKPICLALAEKISHIERRARLPTVRWRRLPGVLRELATGGYARYARNWGSVAIDLLVR